MSALVSGGVSDALYGGANRLTLPEALLHSRPNSKRPGKRSKKLAEKPKLPRKRQPE